MSSAQNTLERRLEQVHCLVTALLLAEESSEHVTARVLSGAFWSVQELVEQARDAFKEMLHERKPDAPVMADGEPIPDLEKELIAVMREMTKELEDVAVTGRGLLDDIDKRDKDG